MRTIFAIFLLTILPVSSFSQKQSFEQDSLFVVWGQANHLGIGDCSANARIASTDTSLEIRIDVVDNKLVLSDDPIHSDHVELWFALPLLYDFDPNSDDSYLEPPYRTSYLWDGNKQLYLFQGKPDLRRFTSEIRSPLIGASNYGMDTLSYASLDSIDESWLKSDIDSYLFEVRRSKLAKVPVHFGITHLGILPGSNGIVLYDREVYSVLEKLIGTQIPDLSRFASCKTTLNSDGYSVAISLAPEAVGFAFKSGIPQLRFMLDVVDVDEMQRQKSVLSTSANRRWGDPSTFKSLYLRQLIRVHASADLPAVGDPRAEDYSGNQSLPINHISNYFLYTVLGWVPVERISDPFYAYNQPGAFVLPNIDKLTFKKGTMSYHTVKKGKDTLGYLSTSQGDYLFVNRKFVFPVRDTLCTFVLSDSSVAVLATHFQSSGTFTRSFYSSLVLAAGSSELQLADISNGMSIRFTDSLRFEGKDWDPERANWDDMESEQNFNWSTIFSWEHFGRSIIVDLGNEIQVRISWDNLGRNVIFERVIR